MDIIIYSLIILYKMYNYLYIKFEEKQIKKYMKLQKYIIVKHGLIRIDKKIKIDKNIILLETSLLFIEY